MTAKEREGESDESARLVDTMSKGCSTQSGRVPEEVKRTHTHTHTRSRALPTVSHRE